MGLSACDAVVTSIMFDADAVLIQRRTQRRSELGDSLFPVCRDLNDEQILSLSTEKAFPLQETERGELHGDGGLN